MTIADICLVVTVSNSEVSKWFSFPCQTCFVSNHCTTNYSDITHKLHRNIFLLQIMCENGGGGSVFPFAKRVYD
jgi:hypothetical protein